MNAVRNIDGLDPNQLIGYLMFYCIPEIKISHSELEDIFIKNSMDKSHLPKKIFEHDAFRRATGQINGKISISLTNGDNVDAKLNVDEVRNDAYEIVRVVGRKVIDSTKAEVEYTPVGRFVFHKKTKVVDTALNDGAFLEYDYDRLLNDTVGVYKEWTNFHTKDTVRNIINKIVKSTQPVSILKGAYFIPKDEYDTLKSLQGVIHDLAQYAPNETPGIELIPLLDTVEQRTMLEERVNKEIIGDVENLMVELADMLKSDKEIHTRTIKRITTDFQTLQDKTKTYTNLLQTSMKVVQDQLLSAIDRFAKVQAEKELGGVEIIE